ncbi:MAG: hypothetical protein C5B50_00770 [Verrucomicrobia bacterium]|nr:MAG: hypothetical protein C5B50_00770 [Verrucomicrobiota bacterium]
MTHRETIDGRYASWAQVHLHLQDGSKYRPTDAELMVAAWYTCEPHHTSNPQPHWTVLMLWDVDCGVIWC